MGISLPQVEERILLTGHSGKHDASVWLRDKIMQKADANHVKKELKRVQEKDATENAMQERA